MIIAGVLLGVAAFGCVLLGCSREGGWGLAILSAGLALVCVGVAVLGWQAVVATSIVIACASAWAWQYLRTYAEREVARGWFKCPYCNSRVAPGSYVAVGSRGRGHWTCVD